jgi:hypothetical protein
MPEFNNSTDPITWVAVLYARRDSVYKAIEGCEVWDAERDARNFPGGMPVVAHPPCRAWGALAHMAKPRAGEKELARSAVRVIRENGGVLEHPFRSCLWPDQQLPALGERDAWGGFTLAIPQLWFGHCMDKATKLYICGCEPRELPDIPLSLASPTHAMGGKWRFDLKKREARDGTLREDARATTLREGTPPRFALWLVAVARLCRPFRLDRPPGAG